MHRNRRWQGWGLVCLALVAGRGTIAAEPTPDAKNDDAPPPARSPQADIQAELRLLVPAKKAAPEAAEQPPPLRAARPTTKPIEPSDTGTPFGTEEEAAPAKPETPESEPSETKPAAPESVAPAPSDDPLSGPPATEKTAPDEPLSEELVQLRNQIHEVLDVYYRRQLNSRDHNHWEVMHAFIAFGVDTYIRNGRPDGPPVNAIAWVCSNRPCRGDQLFYAQRDRLLARQGPNVQGHHGQLLAILAQSRVDRQYPIRVQGQEFSIEDLIDSEMAGCESGSELTFKLLGLMYYLNSDAQWRSASGQNWSLSRLIREEIRQPIRVFNVTCGGTHRLTALSYAFRLREERGEPVDGEFLRAKEFVQQYQRYTFSMQNPDGSLSTEWFRGPGNRPDVARKLQTTGHIFEWLAYSVSPQSLRDPRMVRCARFLADTLLAGKTRPWNIGHMGHAVHGLSLYEQRLFGDGERYLPPSARRLSLALRPARPELPTELAPPDDAVMPTNAQPETSPSSSADSEFDAPR